MELRQILLDRHLLRPPSMWRSGSAQKVEYTP
jgi:hypothetical protein